jgi:GNAT superfamily N-acetyltransferase
MQYMIRFFEELSLNSWPAIQTHLYDGWILRFANGYTKRSNSVSPLYKSTIELKEKIDFCEYHFMNRSLPVVFKLTNDSTPTDIERELDKRNYTIIDETSVRTLDLKKYYGYKPEDLIIGFHFTNKWCKGFFDCSCLENKMYQKSAKTILETIAGKTIVVSKEINKDIVGCGFGVIERDYIGIYDIVVAKHYRNNGIGKDIMNGILNNALQLGCKTAYLSVFVGNTPAENLYQKLGFREIYKYWYRKKS